MKYSCFSFLHIFIIFSIVYARKRRACREGTFLSRRKCLPCPPGTYQNVTNAEKCISCPRGTYNPRRGSKVLEDCIECPVGTFQAGLGAGSIEDCKPCPSGQNAPKGAPSCISCPAGSVIKLCLRSRDDATVSNRGTCKGCNFFKVGPAQCLDIGPTNTVCVECLRTETSDENSFQCRRCPRGTFRFTGSSTCDPAVCPPGTGLTFFGTCRKCSGFQVNDGTNAECEDCPDGFVGDKQLEATKCVPV